MASLRSRLQESNLFVRLAWGLGLTFLVLHLIYNARSAHERLISNAETFAVSTMDRAWALAEVVGANPELLRRLSTENFSVTLLAEKPEPGAEGWPHSAEVESAVKQLLSARDEARKIENLWFEDAGEWRLGDHRGHGPLLVIVLPHESGWLKVAANMRPEHWRNPPGGALWTTLLALLLFVAALWGARRVTRFLPRFAEAAERLGRGESSAPMPLTGPREVRRVALAFNEMQRRVTDHVSERTAMLGAFSHDLRTLATRLNLRLDGLPDDQQRQKAAADLDAMTRILDEALAFARDDTSVEPRRTIDLRSLLQTLVDDAQDSASLAGEPVQIELCLAGGEVAADHWRLRGQPLALRRALSNVIDNAVKYGGQVSVLLSHARMPDHNAPALCIDVRDNGPGIPIAEQSRVLKPYVRLDTSRSRNTGGTGLGLAIVANVVRRHNGILAFLNEVPVTDSELLQQAFVARIILPVDFAVQISA